MDPIAAKYIGAGIACIGMGGAGAGVGIIFGNYLAAAVRNPSAAQGQFGNLIFGFAVTEALGIFSLLIALLLLFALLAMATSAHTEQPGGHKGAFPPFQKETFASQLLWFAVCFIVLYLLMSRIALPRVGGILAARRERIESDLKAAQRLKEDSDAELASYEKALADARARAQIIANEMRDKLNAEAEQRHKGLERDLNAKLAEAEKMIA